MNQSKVFISYAWGGESETLVNRLYKVLVEKGYNVIRDKIDLGYKGNIKKFMQEIGTGDGIVAVLSDKYLRSPNCMYEIVQIEQNGEFDKRIFPIVLPDADIYSPVKRLQYVKYWEEQVKTLNESMKGIDNMGLISEIQQELSEYNQILNAISGISTFIKNTNSLTPELLEKENYVSLLNSLDNQLAKSNSTFTSNNVENNMSKQINKDNSANNSGDENVFIQDLTGNNITININQNKAKEKSQRIDTSLKDITDRRKHRVLKRLDKLYKMLDAWEDKLILAENPKETIRCEDEIENVNEQIEKVEQEVNSL